MLLVPLIIVGGIKDSVNEITRPIYVTLFWISFGMVVQGVFKMWRVPNASFLALNNIIWWFSALLILGWFGSSKIQLFVSRLYAWFSARSYVSTITIALYVSLQIFVFTGIDELNHTI